MTVTFILLLAHSIKRHYENNGIGSAAAMNPACRCRKTGRLSLTTALDWQTKNKYMCAACYYD